MIRNKLLKVQNACINKQFCKNGENPYGNYKYLQLEDFFPFIFNECYKQGLSLEFKFDTVRKSEETQYLDSKLLIVDLESNEIFKVTIPAVEVIQLPQMNLMQSLGAYMTYAKKYLLMNTFFIMSNEDLDSIDTTKSVETVKEVVLTQKEKEELVKIVNDLKQKNNSNMMKSEFKRHIRKSKIEEKMRSNILKYVTQKCEKEINLKEL